MPNPDKRTTAAVPKYRVVSPGGQSARRTADDRVMLLGWRAAPDGLLAPKSAERCDCLHIRGTPGADSARFAAAAAEECARLRAGAVFLELEDTPDAFTREAAAALRLKALTVFAVLPSDHTICVVPDNAPIPDGLTPPFAVYCPARAYRTALSGKHAEKQPLLPEELARLLETHRPYVQQSAELNASYCTIKTQQGTDFLVFDTEASIEIRVGNAVSRGAAAIFYDG